MTTSIAAPRPLGLRVGDLVEVRSAAEILAMLDEQGELDSLPFMPEMLQFCGKTLRVHKVAHKLCDFIGGTGMHVMNDAVHLEDSRCDGQAHGGCQTGCSLYWKEAWLKRVADERTDTPRDAHDSTTVDVSRLMRATRKAPAADGTELFSCQGTEMPRAAPQRIRFFDPRQYAKDFLSGNATLREIVRSFVFGVFNAFQTRSRRALPSSVLIKGGLHWGWVEGTAGEKTPTAHLDLQPGELVRIRSKEEISRTLNSQLLNRGMGFETEMSTNCGRLARVLRRADRCIDEKTGRMVTLKNPCIVLDGVVCRGVYHANCPRAYIPFWREIWLERVD